MEEHIEALRRGATSVGDSKRLEYEALVLRRQAHFETMEQQKWLVVESLRAQRRLEQVREGLRSASSGRSAELVAMESRVRAGATELEQQRASLRRILEELEQVKRAINLHHAR